MKKLIISSIVIAILGTIGIIFGTMVYVQGLVVHPDKVVTVVNPTSNKRTQSYLIGDLQVYIEQTARMNMKTFQQYVNMSGFAKYGDKYEMIPDNGDPALSLLVDNDKADPNPFIVRLNIRNLGSMPHEILARQILIRRSDGSISAPHKAWQERLAKAGFFAGANGKDLIGAGDSETIWLVYGTETAENPFEQEYIRMLYGSDEDWLAIKVEFPFNFVYGTPYGDYDEITSVGYRYGAFALLLFYAVLGVVSWRLYRNLADA